MPFWACKLCTNGWSTDILSYNLQHCQNCICSPAFLNGLLDCSHLQTLSALSFCFFSSGVPTRFTWKRTGCWQFCHAWTRRCCYSWNIYCIAAKIWCQVSLFHIHLSLHFIFRWTISCLNLLTLPSHKFWIFNYFLRTRKSDIGLFNVTTLNMPESLRNQNFHKTLNHFINKDTCRINSSKTKLY